MAEINVVSTASQLLNAIDEGSQDIKIVSHIDFSAVPSPTPALKVSKEIRRIHGDCPTDLPATLSEKVSAAAPGLRRAPGACVIYIHSSFLAIRADTTWLDRLTIVLGPPRSKNGVSDVLVLHEGSLFMTNSQLIGSYQSGAKVHALMRAIGVEEGATKAYFQNVTVTNFTSSIAPVTVAAPATFAGCSLAGRPVPNKVLGGSGPRRRGLAPGALLVQATDVLLTNTSVVPAFSDNGAVLVPASASRVFSDAPVTVVTGGGRPASAEAAAGAGEELRQMAQDAEFVSLQQAPWDAGGAMPPPPPRGGGGDVSGAVLGVIIAAAVVLAAAAAALAVRAWSRRGGVRPQHSVPEELGQPSQFGTGPSQKPASSDGSSSGIRPSQQEPDSAQPSTTVVIEQAIVEFPGDRTWPSSEPWPSVTTAPGDKAGSNGAPGGQGPAGVIHNVPPAQRLGTALDALPPSQHQITGELSDRMAALVSHIAAAAADVAAPARQRAKVEDVLAELDAFPPACATGLHGYAYDLKAPGGKRNGGQGVVVFVPQGVGGRVLSEARAMKIYVRPKAFADELAVFKNPDINKFMPHMFEYGWQRERGQTADGMGCDAALLQKEAELVLGPQGAAHAVLARPYIVMQKGTSLEECMRQHTGDPISELWTLLEVTLCLCQLHAAGYVHRDIKPDNLLRVKLGGQNAWKLIDCGLAARAGTEVSAACTVPFAAPEVLSQLPDGRVVAAPAQDAWSLGVTCFRLLCPQEGKAFIKLTQETIMQKVLGRTGLPWDPAAAAQHGLLPLVRGLLNHDPQQRMSVTEFWQKLAAQVPGSS